MRLTPRTCPSMLLNRASTCSLWFCATLASHHLRLPLPPGRGLFAQTVTHAPELSQAAARSPKTAIEEGPGIPRDSGTALRPSEGQAVGGKDRPGSSHAGYRAVQSVLDPLEELTVPLSHVFGHNYPFP